jgi:hypothetical protein
MQIAGEDGQWDFEAFKGQMLKGCDDIEVQVGSGIPQSKAAKQAAIQQVLNTFIQNGVAMRRTPAAQGACASSRSAG